MRRVLRKGSQQFNILEKREIQPDDKFKEFRDKTSALNFLRGLMRDNLNTVILRNIVKHKLSQTRFSRVGERKVLENLASQLVSGQLRIAVLPVVIPTWSYEAPALEEEKAAAPTAAAVAEGTSWIEIQLVDGEGNPIAEEKYQIKLPSGSIKEGLTDSQGELRLEDIEPGMCRISFPDLSAD